MIEANTDTYVYDETWKDKLISYNGQTITYDAVGNPTNYMGNALTWTMGRQLSSFGNISYTYNEDGIRTSKTSNGITTKFYLDGTNIIEQTDGATTLYFFYDSVGEIVGFKYNVNNYLYIKNSMGDIVGIADAAGNLIASYAYDPWGKVTSVTGSNTAIGELNPFRYRGYYYDSDIQLYYLQSRYYDPEIGRFINSDDVSYIGITTSELSYNPFAYCVNNPTNKVDSTGTLSTFVIVCIIGGALIGGGIGGYVAWKNCKLKKNKELWVLGGILMGAVAGAAIGAVVGMVGETVIAKLTAIGSKVTTKTGFASFSKLKSAIGRAGDGRAWHHIVEQTTSNVNKFGAKMIHNTKNIVNVPHGKGTLHAKLSGYYSSKQPFTNGLTVRK